MYRYFLVGGGGGGFCFQTVIGYHYSELGKAMATNHI